VEFPSVRVDDLILWHNGGLEFSRLIIKTVFFKRFADRAS